MTRKLPKQAPLEPVAPRAPERFEYRVPDGEWSLGTRVYSCRESLAWWRRQQAPIRAWLDELAASGSEWTGSAQHAAFCLAHYCTRDMGWDGRERPEVHSWRDFHVGEFLFQDLWEGGTVGMCGPVEVFFDHLVEAMGRFTDAGVVDDDLGPSLLDEMKAARNDFVLCYSEETPSVLSLAIARRHTTHPQRAA